MMNELTYDDKKALAEGAELWLANRDIHKKAAEIVRAGRFKEAYAKMDEDIISRLESLFNYNAFGRRKNEVMLYDYMRYHREKHGEDFTL